MSIKGRALNLIIGVAMGMLICAAKNILPAFGWSILIGLYIIAILAIVPFTKYMQHRPTLTTCLIITIFGFAIVGALDYLTAHFPPKYNIDMQTYNYETLIKKPNFVSNESSNITDVIEITQAAFPYIVKNVCILLPGCNDDNNLNINHRFFWIHCLNLLFLVLFVWKNKNSNKKLGWLSLTKN